jgi:predicted phosphodiesterase
MRYGVFSDVHSNLEAFEAVCEDFKSCHIDQFLFLGDIVGYGASPLECIEKLKSLDPVSIAGNHDWAVADVIGLDHFNQMAAQSIVWTREKISESERLLLSSLELMKNGTTWRLVHGTLNNPQDFNYMTDVYAAASTFSCLKEQVCFIGHTHKAGILIQNKEKIISCQEKFIKLKKDLRYIVNAGSVGQPRDGNCMASFCIFDDADLSIEFRRVPYDARSARKKIIDIGLPRILGDRLLAGL